MSNPDAHDLLVRSIKSNLPTKLLTASGEETDALGAAASLSFPQPSGEPIVVAKDAPTRYTRSSSKNDEFYPVGMLWLVWIERDSSVSDYLKKAQASGLGNIFIPDRKNVIDYLQGTGSSAGRVVGEAEATTGIAKAEEAGPSRPAPAPKRKYEVNVADREFCKKLRAEEVVLRDRNTVLRVAPGGKVNNFDTFVKTVMKDKIRAFRKSVESGGSHSQPQAAAPVHVSHSARQRRHRSIIMISSAPTSLITMWNVKKFLEEGVFEPSDVARQHEAELGNHRPADSVPVIRKRHGPAGEITTEYFIVDSVEALQRFGPEPWDHVLCVVTTGQAWQFKSYKWPEPRALFRNVKGVYFQWNNESANPAIRDWNVTELRIDRYKRHTDRQVVAEFWRVVDSAKRR